MKSDINRLLRLQETLMVPNHLRNSTEPDCESNDDDDEFVSVERFTKYGRTAEEIEPFDVGDKNEMKTHPLLIQNILYNVLRRLDVYDLISCREVCRIWWEMSTPVFLNGIDQIQICFSGMDEDTADEDDNDDPEQDDKDNKECGAEKVSRYLRYLDESKQLHDVTGQMEIKYTNFLFTCMNMSVPSVHAFFKYYGSDVKVLKFSLSDVNGRRVYDIEYMDSEDDEEGEGLSDNDSDFSDEIHNPPTPPRVVKKGNTINVEVFENILLQCLNLKSLAIFNLPAIVKNAELFKHLDANRTFNLEKVNITHQYQTPMFTARFLKSLFGRCPILKELRSDHNYDSCSQDRRILRTLSEAGRLNSLSSLYISDADARVIQILSESTMKLERIKFNQYHFDIKETTDRFLLNQSDCLKKLVMEYYSEVDEDEAIVANFPVMKNLQHLGIRHRIFPGASSLGPFNFKFHFPHLRRLEITGKAEHFKLDEVFADIVHQDPLGSLKELELPESINNPVLVTQLGSLFPNVTKLTMSAQNDSTSQVIWDTWPLLDELFLCVNQTSYDRSSLGLDCLLTGIPKVVCQQILKQRKYFEIDLSRIQQNSSITKLQHLKRLTLHAGPSKYCWSGHRSNDEWVTDASGYLALSKIPSLDYLHVDGGIQKISKACTITLSNQLDMYVMDMGHGVNLLRHPSNDISRKPKPLKWHATERKGSCTIC